MSLKDKTVIVTGGAQGIGRAIVDRFVALGAKVAVIDVNPVEPTHENVVFVVGDVSRADDVTRFVADVTRRTGRVDVLVNNAGIIRDNVIWRMPEEDFDDVLKVNLKGPWLMCKEVTPLMKQQKGGRIINIASRAWLGNFGQSNYSSSKGGLVSLTRVLALELARYNVTVNAVAPGLIDTPLTQSLTKEALQKLIDAQPGGRIGSPEDIANGVTFLASD